MFKELNPLLHSELLLSVLFRYFACEEEPTCHETK